MMNAMTVNDHKLKNDDNDVYNDETYLQGWPQVLLLVLQQGKMTADLKTPPWSMVIVKIPTKSNHCHHILIFCTVN